MTNTCGLDKWLMQPLTQLKDAKTPGVRQPHFSDTSSFLGNSGKASPVTN